MDELTQYIFRHYLPIMSKAEYDACMAVLGVTKYDNVLNALISTFIGSHAAINSFLC